MTAALYVLGALLALHVLLWLIEELCVLPLRVGTWFYRVKAWYYQRKLARRRS